MSLSSSTSSSLACVRPDRVEKEKKRFEKTPIPIGGEPGDDTNKIIYNIYKRDMTIHSVCVRV